MKHFDKFTDGKFDGSQWSAPRLNTLEKVERALDEFQLVGRTIRSIQTVGISFAHRMDEIDEYAHQLIQQLPEDQKQGKEGFDDLEPEMEMERYLELDEPLLIHFEDGDTFEIDTPWEDIWYMSMNRIPPRIK